MLNNYLLIKPIDNTKTGSITDSVFVKGYSHLTNLINPNCGELNGKTIYFINYGAIKSKDKLIIKESDIFLEDNELTKPGIIVTRVNIDQSDNGFVYRNQDWFMVVKSNCDIPERCLVVAKASTAYKFNHNKKKYYFISPNNVLLIFNNKLLPGENIVLDVVDTDIVFNKKPNRSKKYYFSKHYGSIIFDNKTYAIIDRTSIYATN